MSELARKQQRLKSLIAKKEQYFSRFQKLYDCSKRKGEPAHLDYFRTRYETLEESKKAFLDVLDEIQLVEGEINPEYVPSYKILDAFDELYCHIKIAAKSIIKNELINPPANKTIPKLPKLQIPNFNGNQKDWPIFIECFNNLIHHNETLSDVDRVHYLVGSLSSTALTVCSGIPPTGDNYRIIYQALVDKFSDKRVMANNYLDQIINFKQAQSETAGNLNAFLEKFDVAVKSLQKLQIDNLEDYILAYLALSKLNPETQRSFENAHRKTEMPSYNDIVTFVKEQAKICTRSTSKKCNSFSENRTDNKSKQTHSFLVQDNKPSQSKCTVCRNNVHPITGCPKFLSMFPMDRYTFARNNNLCLNCLGTHKIINCKSNFSCKTCKLRHHSLLHFNKPSKSPNKVENNNLLDCSGIPEASLMRTSVSSGVPNSQNVSDSDVVASTSKIDGSLVNYCSITNDVNHEFNKIVLLSTVKVNISDGFGKQHVARFLLDSCSQANFLTLDFCKRLKLKITKSYREVQGIDSSFSKIFGYANIVIVSQIDPTKKYPLEVLVVQNITKKLPQVEVNTHNLSHLAGIPLADDTFYQPNQIDGIIGAEIYPYVLGKGRIVGSPKAPIALETSLGYVVMGSVSIPGVSQSSHNFCSIVDPPLETLVKRFWEIDDICSSSVVNPDDIECERIYQSTFSRDRSGRYTVALPFQYNPSNLGDSYAMAKRRLLSLEKKFVGHPDFKGSYSEIISDYLSQDHMTLVSIVDSCPSLAYYIPHHAVYKPDSSSTPIRIVFDASAKTDSGYSLNDLLYTGPKLQIDVVTIFLIFRLYSVAFIADLRQMYRQILVHPKFRCFQRVLWRFSPEDPVSIYELNTVSFGVKCSPYLALRTVHQLATDEQSSYSVAAEVVKHHMYMDDLVSSISTADQAIHLYRELVELFGRGGFELVKWATNSDQLFKHIPEQNRSSPVINFDVDFLKVLGLQWHPKSDTLSFSLDITAKKCSKRNVLSAVARCFDPLGFLSPVTLQAKLLIKNMWTLNLDWDDTPPDDMVQWWGEFQQSLPLLAKLSIPRHIGAFDNCSAMLIGFADACQTSYGAMVYIRIDSAAVPYTSLLYAKTKVAPMKVLSIPRLELTASLLLAKLLSFVKNIYSSRIKIEKIIALSDSTVALSWLNTSPCRWTTFVANRVAKIQELVCPSSWYHIASKENISDCLSRGLSPSRFIENKLWLSGPLWLKRDFSCWPIKPVGKEHNTKLEEKPISLVTVHNEIHPIHLLAGRCSSWLKLLRSVAYVLRFIKLLPRRIFFSADDLIKTEMVILKVVQNFHFRLEIKMLQQNGICSSSLRHLCPFMHEGILRVGGRLVNSNLGFDITHPILLPKHDRVVDLLIDHYHRSYLHTGPHLVLSLLRQKYWILSARSVVRHRIKKCNVCFKLNPKPQFPLMGNLPDFRVRESKPFLHTGVDYCGPFQIIPYRKRGVRSQKCYISVFVCVVTKAVHLELVSDLSTENFLAAFKRFLSRRGLVTNMYSDCGTNFIGAKSYLDELYLLVGSDDFNENVASELSKRGINWKLNPPYTPHFGGLWESNVRCLKTHLFRVMGHQLLTYEEMNTLLTQIEALLNSRPLCVLSSDPAEPLALTPAHFLTLTPLKQLPAQDVTLENINRLNRFQMIDRMIQDYWKRWRLEYLTSLQARQRWTASATPIKCGTVVLLEKPNTPPLHWPLGVINETFPGKDGQVRVVTVKMKTGIYKRPVVKVCPLPTQ